MLFFKHCQILGVDLVTWGNRARACRARACHLQLWPGSAPRPRAALRPVGWGCRDPLLRVQGTGSVGRALAGGSGNVPAPLGLRKERRASRRPPACLGGSRTPGECPPTPQPLPASGHSLPSIFQLREQSVVSRPLCLPGGQVQLLRPPAALPPALLQTREQGC